MDCIQLINFNSYFDKQEQNQQFRALYNNQQVEAYESICYKNITQSKILDKEDNSYCYPCFIKKVESMRRILLDYQNKINKQKEQLKEQLKQKEILLRIEQKKQYLKLLQNKNKELQDQLEKHRKQLPNQHQIKNSQLVRDKLKNKLQHLQGKQMINESDLLSKRSLLRKMQASLILKGYTLFEINYCYPNFQIVELLKYMTVSNLYFIEDEYSKSNNDKDLSKITFQTQNYNQYTLDHKLIINYSILNLFRFIQYVVSVKKFQVPYIFKLNIHQQPYLICNDSGQKIQLFGSNPMPIEENFIYCWINYLAIYKRLGLQFKKLVINQNTVFPVQQLKDLFMSEQYIPDQLFTSEHTSELMYNEENRETEQRCILSDLLKVSYPSNSFYKYNEEINYLRDNSELKIIMFNELNDDEFQIKSKVQEYEYDSDEYEIIDYN